jgi:hypothetical protein
MFALLLTLIMLAKPAWISIEYPVNPMDPGSRGAYLLVRTFHAQMPGNAQVRGEAVTWENGTRRAVPLRFESTDRPGVYKLAKQWSDRTAYVLVINAGEGEGTATALVSVSPAGAVTRVEVPTQPSGAIRVPRPVREEEISAAFRAAGGTA